MMMEHNNPNNSSRSRFSGEERARITAENAKARAAVKKEAESFRKDSAAVNRTVSVLSEKKEAQKKEETARKRIRHSADNSENSRNSASAADSPVINSESEEKKIKAHGEDKKRSRGSREKIAKAKKTANSVQPDKGSRNERVRSSTEKRKKDTKIKNALIVTALFVSAACMIALLCVVILKINTVEVVNNDRYTVQEVVDAAKIKKGSSMLLVNSAKISEEIERKLPYAENVKVERKWPDKIVITMETAVPTFAIDTGRGYIYLSDSCKVLETSGEFLVSTAAFLKGITVEKCTVGEQIVLSGEVKAGDIVNLISVMRDSGIGEITSLDLSDDSCAVLVLDHRIEVELGSLSQADEKLMRFAGRVIEETEKTDSSHEIVIDLTGDKEARVRVKNSNEVNFEEEPTDAPEQFG